MVLNNNESMYFYLSSLSSWFLSSLSSFIQVWSHWESNMLLLKAAKLRGLFLRSLVDHKAAEECSFRPILFHLIIKLLFLTVCFLLRRLSEVWNSLSCCLLTQKGSGSGGGSSCLCEGALFNGIKIDICAGRAGVQLPHFQTTVVIIVITIAFLSWMTCSYDHTWKKRKWSSTRDSMNQFLLFFFFCCGWLSQKNGPSSSLRESVFKYLKTL